MSKRVVLLLVVVLGLVGMAQAEVVYFWGNASGDWSDLAVWGGATTLPSPTSTNQDIAIAIGGVTINVTTDGMGAIDLMGGYHTGHSTINVAAGKNLQIVHLAQIGCGGDGDENIATGELNVYGTFYSEQLWVGAASQDDSGIVNIYDGGSMTTGYWGNTIGNTGTGTGTLNIIGGNYWTASPLTINAKGLVNIEAGVLRVLGDKVADLQAYINAGKIVGYNGAGTVNAPVVDGDWTIVTAVPEPATMILLGLGGLVLCRRNAVK